MRFAAALVLVAACSANAAREPRTFQVEIRGMQFVPASLRVHRGDLVVWTNKDIVPHTVTAAGWFDSGSLAPGQQWSYGVRDDGIELDYVCSFHPTMKGALVVQ